LRRAVRLVTDTVPSSKQRTRPLWRPSAPAPQTDPAFPQ
jgi:hypothetical protein